jgi:alpha-1,3-glucosyltransferase
MEITLNLKAQEWYVETLDNSLNYWRIDYPPLSAYVSLFFGYISDFFYPESMVLFKSRGYENLEHKVFMRLSVIFCDVLLFFSALYKVC